MDENPRAESNTMRTVKNNNREQEQTKGIAEHLSRRGYYSRNGGPGGYRGL